MKIVLVISIVFNIIAVAAGILAIKRLGGLNVLLIKLLSRPATPTDPARMQLFEIMDSMENKIVFLGDSITEFCDWSELFGKAEIVNRGIGGDITEGVLRRIGSVQKEKPRAVFLMIGINDLLRGGKPEVVIANYEQILAELKKVPDLKVYVQSILPVNKVVSVSTKLTNAEIEKVNKEIRIMAEHNSFTFLNLYPAFTDETGYLEEELSTDGLHLSGKGYLVWKEKIQPIIQSL